MPKATSQEKKVEQADTKRVGKQAEETVAQADKERMLATQHEGELNRIAGDLPDDPKALWMFTESSFIQATTSIFDTGRALIKLKEILPHGAFGPELNERGIPARTARNFMAVARAFSERGEKLKKLSRAKLFACLELFPEELDALEDGDSVLGITLDDFDRMTPKELKAAIKKRDTDLEIKDQLLESKNKQIDSIATELEKSKGNITEGDASPVVQEIESAQAQILIPLMKLRARALNFEVDAGNGKEPNRAEYFALQAALNVLRDEMAQAMDALYNCGGSFQAAIAEASMPTDAEG